eukprot:229725-Pelagomonas_calceolata.AAC.1
MRSWPLHLPSLHHNLGRPTSKVFGHFSGKKARTTMRIQFPKCACFVDTRAIACAALLAPSLQKKAPHREGL